LFHNANLFGSCIIHILYTEYPEIKKKSNSGAKELVMYANRNTKETHCQLKNFREFFEQNIISLI